MKIAVTGSSGYVGSVIVAYLRGLGFEVLELSRLRAADFTGVRRLEYSLEAPIDPSVLVGVHAVIHCAYDMKCTGWREIQSVNVVGSARLVEAAQCAGVPRIVLISSISAFPGAASMYGRAKLMIEAEFLRVGGVVVRPGLVYGDVMGGMMGTLARIVAKFPLIPAPGVAQNMFLVHETDLARLLELAIVRDVSLPGAVYACHEESIPFGEVLRKLGRRFGKSPWVVPIPWQCAWSALRIAELAGLRLGVKSDSLVSMMNPVVSPDFTLTRSLGCAFRPFI